MLQTDPVSENSEKTDHGMMTFAERPSDEDFEQFCIWLAG